MAADLLSRFFCVTFHPPCLLLAFCLSCVLFPVDSSNPVMANPVINSQNKVHWANGSSYIKWGDLPKTKSIDIFGEKKSDGLEPLFAFSRFFINNALNDKLPTELIQHIKSGKFDLLHDIEAVIKDHIGLLATIIVGLVFIVLFPIIGICFCFCRCCGKCGGKMIQSRENRSPTRRRILSFLLFLGVAFSASGTAFMFASDIRLMSSIKRFPDILPKAMKIFADYGDNAYTQVEFVGDETVDFLLDVIKRDLNSLDVLVGKPLREELDQKAHIRNIFKTIDGLATDIGNLESSMNATQDLLSEIKTKGTDLNNKMSNLQQSIDTDYNKCKGAGIPGCKTSFNTDALKKAFSPNKIPDISNEIKQLSNVDLGKIQEPKKDFEDIPELVQNKSVSKVQDVIKMLDDVQNRIPEYLKVTKKYTKQMENGTIGGQDLGAIQAESNKYMDMVRPYNQIRRYIFLGLAGLCLFIVSLLFLGLIFGICGQDDMVSPVKRGSASNCGGCLLIGSVYLIFLLGGILMLLTTAMFIPGAIVEVYGCKPLRRIGDGAVDNLVKTISGQTFSQILFKNDSYDVKISHIYNGCKNGQGLYKAAYLKYFVNLDSILNYPKDKGVENEIEAIKVNMSDVEIYTPEIKKQLEDFQSSLNIDFAHITSEISKTNAQNGFDILASKLDTLGQVAGTYGASFKKYANDVRSLKNTELKQLINTKTNLQTNLVTCENNTISANNSIKKVMSELEFAQNVITNSGSAIVKDVLGKFANRILSIWDNFVIYINNLLNNKIAQCRPLTNLYTYAFIDVMCGTIDSYNAFWFGLGWCLFFLVLNLIFAVKLSKYFRRMEYTDELDGSTDVLPGGNVRKSSRNGSMLIHRNKVAQCPRY